MCACVCACVCVCVCACVCVCVRVEWPPSSLVTAAGKSMYGGEMEAHSLSVVNRRSIRPLPGSSGCHGRSRLSQDRDRSAPKDPDRKTETQNKRTMRKRVGNGEAEAEAEGGTYIHTTYKIIDMPCHRLVVTDGRTDRRTDRPTD